MASIRFKNHEQPFGSGFACNGILYNDRTVLTSKQCVYNHYEKKVRDSSEFTIMLGSPHRTMLYKTMLEVNVADIITHKDSQVDLAILRLETEVLKDTEGIKPISIKISNDTSGLEGYILGWGEVNDAFSGFSYMLRKLEVTVADKSKCESLGMRQAAGIACVTTKTGDKGSACNGDLGGPFVSKGELVGLVSAEKACKEDNNQPAVLTLLSYHKKWIDTNFAINIKALSLVTLISLAIVTCRLHH